MKKMKTLLTLCVLIITGTSIAQDLDLKWSDKQMYDNKKDGFFSSFIDANSKYIYCRYSNYSTPRKANKKIKLVAFDKVTMKKVGDVAVVGFKENASSKDKYKGLTYHKTIVLEDILYVFWLKDMKGKEELYVQSFNANLKPINKLKKVYEANTIDSRYSKRTNSTVVISNRKAGEKIIIGSELPVTSLGQDVKFEYKVLNSDFTFSAANTVTLPISLKSKAYGLTSSYEFGDDGNLYVRSFATMSKEERKNAKKGEQTSYSILTHIDINSGAATPYTIKYDNKNIFNFNYLIDANGIKLYGFFCDLEKDPRGINMNGLFYTRLDNKTFTSEKVNFAFFDKSTLDKLFANDTEDKKNSGRSKKKKKKNQDEESLDNLFQIEDVQSIDKDNVVIFTSKMYNYSVTTCTTNSNGSQSCTTRYYCQKSNVTAFKVNANGDLVWASNLDRKITYSGWFVYDLKVINQNNKFYLIYGSEFQTNAEKKNRKSRKSKSQRRDRFEYAVFEYETGNYRKNEFVVNPVNSKDKKSVDPVQISVIDNKFFVNSEKISFKALPTTLYCVGSVACWPLLLFYPAIMPNLMKGKGNLGVITPLK